MEIETITLILSIVSILFTGVTAFFSIYAYATCVGLEKSTHQVQMVPLEGYGGPTGDELVADMGKEFNEFAQATLDQE